MGNQERLITSAAAVKNNLEVVREICKILDPIKPKQMALLMKNKLSLLKIDQDMILDIA